MIFEQKEFFRFFSFFAASISTVMCSQGSALKKIVIFGNSASGKSTLAKELCEELKLSHLDLDTVAWEPVSPPERKPIAKSKRDIDVFMNTSEGWVIEGCYSDLLEIVVPQADEIIFLNLPIEECIANAKKRPWEPHKYASKEAQDADLDMLIDWIGRYSERKDTFSRLSHEALFHSFKGKKTMYTRHGRIT